MRMPKRMSLHSGYPGAHRWPCAPVADVHGPRDQAVAQDEGALRLMGADPVRIKRWAFGIATATCAIAGALLIIIGPVDPNLDRLYIGRTFCVVVLAGLGSMSGTMVAGLILGVAESIVLSTAGTAWAPAVAFGILLLVLGVRPAGLFGR
jgi:branched-chain amino acid transport system permease protein